MTAVLIIIGAVVLVIFKNDWKKCIYLLLFMVPFFGFIQLKIVHLTRFAPLIHDITIILPMYFLYIWGRKKKENSQIYLPSNLKNILLFFIFLIFIFTINPFFAVGLESRLIGVKVWIFYLLFIFIGFDFIESELELKKLCNFIAIVAIIPCIIGILQYLGSFFVDHKLTMIAFYNGNVELALASTQNFTSFDWGAGVKMYRLPSTFSMAAQFYLFTMFALIPAVTSVGLSATLKEKYFYSMIVVLIILGSYSSGVRGSFVYTILIFMFLVLIRTKFFIILLPMTLMFMLLPLLNLDSFPIVQSLVVGVTDITKMNIEGYLFKDIGTLLSNNLLGNGVGSVTAETRHAANPTDAALGILGFQTGQLLPSHEGFYYKTIFELGALGLLTVIVFFMIIIYNIVLSIQYSQDNRTSLFCALVLSVFLVMIIIGSKGQIIFTKYPANFLFYFFLGIALKLGFLNLDNEKKSN